LDDQEVSVEEVEGQGQVICPHCGCTVREEDRYLMSADPEAPRFGELLRGEGQPFHQALARIAALGIIFVAAAVCFWALSQALS
jgi:hypothetical protein